MVKACIDCRRALDQRARTQRCQACSRASKHWLYKGGTRQRCAECGRQFAPEPINGQAYHRKYCSNICRYAARSKAIPQERSARMRAVKSLVYWTKTEQAKIPEAAVQVTMLYDEVRQKMVRMGIIKGG